MLTHEIIIDPFLLCLPNPCYSQDQIEDFVSAIVGWRGFLDRRDVCVLLSDSARSALNEDDEFPHRYRLTDLIKRFECAFADVNTISKVANSILERTPSLEDYFGINVILTDEETSEVTPAFVLDRLKDHCRSAFRNDLLIVGIKDNESAAGGEESRLMVASARFNEVPTPTEISVKADIHDIGLASKDSGPKSALPISLDQNIPVSFSHEEMINSLDIWDIWNTTLSEKVVRSCIESCSRSLISSGIGTDKKSDFIIGNGFIASLHEWKANVRRDYAMITIESCARIALGCPKNHIGEFTESTGSPNQLTREDGALAFRTHLTKKGVALRLMFWKHLDGTIEFANIGGKSELKIL
jgi:hypothetical protein